MAKHYHQPSDAYSPSWDLRGMVQQVQFVLELGRTLAESPQRPTWIGEPPVFR